MWFCFYIVVIKYKKRTKDAYVEQSSKILKTKYTETVAF